MTQPGNIACPECGKSISMRALACKYCGALLQEIDAATTDTLVVQRPNLNKELTLEDNPRNLKGTSRFSPDEILYLSIERLNTPLARYVRDEPVILGRVDTDETSELTRRDIDLGPYNARERGVSRKHAHIFRKDGLLYIADLGSSNGTTLNGEELPPNQPHKLRDGDEIMLGRMMVWVNF